MAGIAAALGGQLLDSREIVMAPRRRTRSLRGSCRRRDSARST
jgi:hypothetical protein